MLKRVIDTGQALDKFKEMVKYQHGMMSILVILSCLLKLN